MSAAARAGRGIAALGLALVLAVPGATAQEVTFSPRRGDPGDDRLAAFLESGGYALWTRDTVVARGTRVEGSLLILEAVARIAGEVTGNVYVVDGDLFLRPGAAVHGDVVVLGGGYYGSGMATVAGEVVWRPADRYAVMPSDGGYAIHPVVDLPPPVDLHGLYGFEAPTYQRVDAVTIPWGITFRAASWGGSPDLELVVRYRTGQGAFEGTVRQFWHPGALELGVEAERVTRTNEGWIRGGVSNSPAYLLTGDDFRDYYTADRVALVVRGDGTSPWSPEVRVEWEDAASRNAGDHWTLFGADEVRPNPAIDDGETWSAAAGVTLRRDTGRRGRLAASATVEVADSTVAGDFSYLLGEVRARWTTAGFGSHEVDLYVLGRGDLSGELPGQRWTGFGGRATLPTYAVMRLRGPRVLYGQLGYFVPIEALRAGGLGAPGVFARAASGAAWASGESVDFRTNLIGGVRFWVLEGGVAVEPDGGDVLAYAVLRLPGDL